MALCQTSVLKVYHAIIEDVITNVRDAFLDEGVDEQVLQEMKQIWRSKLMASKAVEINAEPDSHPPQIIANNPKPSKTAAAKAKKAAAAAAAQNNNNTAGSSEAGVKLPDGSTINRSLTTNGGTATGGPGAANALGNMGRKVKEEPQSNNPPPLHPTTAALAKSAAAFQQAVQAKAAQQLHQQQSAAGSSSGAASSSSAGGPLSLTSGSSSGSISQAPAQSPSTASIPIVAALDPNRIMPVNITLPAQPGTVNTEPRVLTIHVPASALQENQLTQILTAHLISSIMSLPSTLASSVLQQHVNAALMSANLQKNFNTSKQLDGAFDTSDEDESEESDDNLDNEDDDDLDKDDDEDAENDLGAEEEPLNSEDDVTDEDASDLFDTDNVIVCQYDKITRSRNKWKFYLKDGIMNIGGKDYVFQKSNGDAEW